MAEFKKKVFWPYIEHFKNIETKTTGQYFPAIGASFDTNFDVFKMFFVF